MIRDATTPERVALGNGLTRLHPHRDAVGVLAFMVRIHDRRQFGWLLMDLAGCVVVQGDHNRTLPPHKPGDNVMKDLTDAHVSRDGGCSCGWRAA